MSEAYKFIVWPKSETEEGGQKLYRYMIAGVVVTDKPINFPNETFVMDTGTGEVTEMVTRMVNEGKTYVPNHRIGDVSDAVLSMGCLTPENCSRVIRCPQGDWVAEISSGFDGFRCRTCGTWTYADRQLSCDCDPENKD